MKKLVQFIKYNNAFTIIISLILFSTAGAFANEKVRDTVIGQTIVTKNGTDNTQIISANLDSFDMGLKINSVKEDTQFYYVNFNYSAIDAKDGVWQSVVKEKNINVSKSRLGDTDLGVYLSEELKQLTDREMAYMKEVQNIEKNKGLQKQTESVEYTGLKGLVFNSETKELVGYEPVKEEERDKTIVIEAAALTIKAIENKEEDGKDKKADSEKTVQQITVVKETISKETIMEMVREAMAQEQGAIFSSSSSSSVISGGGGGAQAPSENSSSSESSSSLPAGEAVSTASSSTSSTSDVLPSQSSSSTLDVIPAASSSESSSSSSEAISSSSSSEAVSSSSSESLSSVAAESSSNSAESSSSSAGEASSSSLPTEEAGSSSSEASSSGEISSSSSETASSSSEPAP